MREIPPPVFSRRSFLFFIILAPACLLTVAGIVLALQYKQFRTLVSPVSTIAPMVVTEDTRLISDAVLTSLTDFVQGSGHDTLVITPEHLNALAAISPVLTREEMRFHFSTTATPSPASPDSASVTGDAMSAVNAADPVDEEPLLVVESSRPLNALNGRIARVFQRIAPVQDGWLNARMEGLPELKAGQLAFAPERGFMNEAKVPRAAMTKRGGMSPKDFLEPAALPRYAALITVLDTVYWNGAAVVLVRASYDSIP